MEMDEGTFLLLYGALFGVPLLLAVILFWIDSVNHMKWLNEREAYWDNMRKEREEKERMKS